MIVIKVLYWLTGDVCSAFASQTKHLSKVRQAAGFQNYIIRETYNLCWKLCNAFMP